MQLFSLIPFVATAVFAFVTIRYNGTSILDFLLYSVRFFLVKPQQYEWRSP